MPKRPQLESDIEHLDAFIGISSHLRDYRLAYQINQLHGFTLEKTDDLPAFSAMAEKFAGYACYIFDDDENQLKYFLLSNTGSKGLLVPTQKEAGYFLLIRGLMDSGAEAAIVAQLKNIPNVLTAYAIDQHKIPNIENLLSDLELHEINLKRNSKAKSADSGSI